MIKMKNGTFGLPVDGIVKPMTKNSGPFEAGEEQEARLVALGLAEYVGEVPETGESDGAPIGFDETPPELPELPEGVTAIPEYSIATSAKELRKIGKMCGLSFGVGMTKEAMVEALDKHIEENTVEDAEIEGESDGAPVFDASEAVQ